jgi:flagellar hook-associated protein FlgK
MDIRHFRRAGNQIAIFTPNGQPLLDATPRVLSFDERSNIGATARYDADPRGVGTVTLSGPEGRVDLLADGGMESGRIAGLAQVRDGELVRAQDQLDELAHSLALALSERLGTVASTVDAAATVNGANPVVAVDLAGLETAGDTATVTLSLAGPVTLTAIDPADAPPAAGEFVADPDPEVRLENLRAAMQTAIDGAAGAGEFTVSVVAGATAGGGAGPMLTIEDANIGANDDITALTTQYVAQDGDALPASLSASQGQLDVSGITQPGDSVMLRYRDTSGAVRTVELTAIADPDGGPVPENSFILGATPEDTAAAIRTQLAAAISTFEAGATSLSVDFPGAPGTTLTVLDGAPGTNAEIVSLHAVSRSAGEIGGDETQFAVFADGAGGLQKAYVGAEPVTAADDEAQKLGFAARISVSNLLLADDTLLVAHPTPPNQAPTGAAAIGSSTRPLDLLARLTETPRSFDPEAGIGSDGAPYVGSVQSYAISMVSFQAVRAAEAADQKGYQDAVRQNIELRFDQSAGVNVDKEMADLLTIENAYASSARVLQTVQTMLDELMQMVR